MTFRDSSQIAAAGAWFAPFVSRSNRTVRAGRPPTLGLTRGEEDRRSDRDEKNPGVMNGRINNPERNPLAGTNARIRTCESRRPC